MDLINFLFAPPHSSKVHLHESLGSKRARAFSDAVAFSSQSGGHAWVVSYRRSAFFCTSFVSKGLHAKDVHKEMFSIYGGKCLSWKAFHNWVDKFPQGLSKVTDDARLGHPVEIVTEATLQRVEESIRADRRTPIGMVSTALGISHGLAYSIMHDHLKFWKVCAPWVRKELINREKN
jgi:hypothetical protein